MRHVKIVVRWNTPACKAHCHACGMSASAHALRRKHGAWPDESFAEFIDRLLGDVKPKEKTGDGEWPFRNYEDMQKVYLRGMNALNGICEENFKDLQQIMIYRARGHFLEAIKLAYQGGVLDGHEGLLECERMDWNPSTKGDKT